MDSCTFERSLGAAPAVANPASRKRRLEESAVAEDCSAVVEVGFSTADDNCCFFKAGA